MKEKITIRPATPEDRSTILSFVTQLSDFEFPLYDGLRPGAESAKEYFEKTQRAGEGNQGQAFIAECDGEPVGFVWLRQDEDKDVLLRPDARLRCYITDIYVVPAFRGHGVGRLLLDEAERYCRSLGLERLQLHVIASNRQARKAYEAQGFEAIAVAYEKRLKL